MKLSPPCGTKNGVRVRFAPSPTGRLHIGNARTALYNFLFARHCGGRFVLRIEDTDLKRSSASSEKSICEDLGFLGITWDEGVGVGGDFGPYRQTERAALYGEYAKKLLDSSRAYPCFCSQEELEEQREAAKKKKLPPRYSGKCRKLSCEEVEKLKISLKPYSVRFSVPEGQTLRFNDLVRGPVSVNSDTIGDFVIIRSDGMVSYNFAVVVDDALMKISHVIRGEDHLPNTPKQVLIYSALGWNIPQFAHISMILGENRQKLSKRNGISSIADYRKQGFLPIGIINYLSLLGWSPGDKKEVMELDEIIAAFSVERLAKSAAVFDAKKLLWINSAHLRNMETATILEESRHFIAENKKTAALLSLPRERLEAMVDSVRDSIGVYSALPGELEVYASLGEGCPLLEEDLEIVRSDSARAVISAFLKNVKGHEKIDIETFGEVSRTVKKETGVKGKKLFHPIRLALTGKSGGPELSKIMPILGLEACVERLEKALLLSSLAEKPVCIDSK